MGIMKDNTSLIKMCVLCAVLLLISPATVQAQFGYTPNADGVSCTITNYTGSGGVVSIPTNIDGLTVTGIGDGEDSVIGNNDVTGVIIPATVIGIGDSAFATSRSLAAVTIPGSVISVGESAFANCVGLTNVTVPASVTSIGAAAFSHCEGLTNITIANGVTSIGMSAFVSCIRLTNITIPASVTNLSEDAFSGCTSLTGAYFAGNAPTVGSNVFYDDDAQLKTYYLPGMTGWSSTFWSYLNPEAVLWNPLIQATGTNFGVRSNKFGFNITGTANIPIVVQAATSLAGSTWTRLTNVLLTNGSLYFSEAQWTNYPGRYYRISSP